MTEPEDKLCPGMHNETRPAPTLRPDETLCRYCVGRTMSALERMPEQLADLDDAIARLAVIRHTGTRGRARGHDDEPDDVVGDEAPGAAAQRLPYDPAAANVRREISTYLMPWANHIGIVCGLPNQRRERPMTPQPARPARPSAVRCQHDMVEGTCAICRGLPDLPPEIEPDFVNAPLPRTPPNRRPINTLALAIAVLRSRQTRNWLRVDEQGPTLAQAVQFVAGRLRSSVDRFDRRWYAGECGAPITEVVLDEKLDDQGRATGDLTGRWRDAHCTADLYAEPGKAVITCDGYREPKGIGGCGALHPAVSRHKYVLRTMRDRELPLDAILSVTPQLLGHEVNPETVKKWRQRGRLRPLVCLTKHPSAADRRVCRRCNLYRGADVLDLVVDDKPRTGPRRRQRRRVSA